MAEPRRQLMLAVSFLYRKQNMTRKYNSELFDKISSALHAEFGPPQHDVKYIRSYRAPSGMPIDLERRNMRFINIRIPWSNTNRWHPHFAEVYPPDRERMSNLSPECREGNCMLRIKVHNDSELQEAMHLIRACGERGQ